MNCCKKRESGTQVVDRAFRVCVDVEGLVFGRTRDSLECWCTTLIAVAGLKCRRYTAERFA